MESKGMAMMSVAKSRLNIYTVGSPLIINRSFYAHTQKGTGTKD